MAYADYIYRDMQDTVRVRIYRRSRFEWDYHLFHRGTGKIETYSETAGDVFRTRADAKKEVEHRFGKLVSINPKGNVCEGW